MGMRKTVFIVSAATILSLSSAGLVSASHDHGYGYSSYYNYQESYPYYDDYSYYAPQYSYYPSYASSFYPSYRYSYYSPFTYESGYYGICNGQPCGGAFYPNSPYYGGFAFPPGASYYY